MCRAVNSRVPVTSTASSYGEIPGMSVLSNRVCGNSYAISPNQKSRLLTRSDLYRHLAAENTSAAELLPHIDAGAVLVCELMPRQTCMFLISFESRELRIARHRFV